MCDVDVLCVWGDSGDSTCTSCRQLSNWPTDAKGDAMAQAVLVDAMYTLYTVVSKT